MNRIIKFRGKRIDNGEWVFGSGIVVLDDGYAAIPQTKDVSSTHFDIKLIKVIPETVGQYTGESDQNKNEIYEGDFVSGFHVKIKPLWRPKREVFRRSSRVAKRRILN